MHKNWINFIKKREINNLASLTPIVTVFSPLLLGDIICSRCVLLFKYVFIQTLFRSTNKSCFRIVMEQFIYLFRAHRCAQNALPSIYLFGGLDISEEIARNTDFAWS